MDKQEKESVAVKPSLLFALGTALTFGLLGGSTMGIARWATDEVAQAYLTAGLGDVIFAYLQYFLNQSIFAALAIFLGVEILFYLWKRVLPGAAERTLGIVHLMAIALLLFGAAIYDFHSQTWFPLALSRRALIYALTLAASGLIALAYLWFLNRQLRSASGSFSKIPAISAIVVFVAINGVAFFKRQNAHQPGSNVIIILIDALRFDHLGCYGYARPTSPAIDAFAKESLLFTQAISQSSYTKPAIASLFTSLYPSQHNVFRNTRHDAQGNFISDVLDDSLKTMAEYLRDAGFNTVGFLKQAQLRNYMGFAQGFHFYNPDMGTAPEINRGFFRWLPLNKHRKFFAYLHYLDVHAPYVPSPQYRDMFFGAFDTAANFPEQVKDWQKFKNAVTDGNLSLTQADAEQLKALYDAEIRAFDDDLAALFNRLKEEGVYDNSLIIITADHGDEFLEHGSVDHAHTLYDELLRVPLIIRFPKGEYRGVIDYQVQTIDLLPTVLEFLGLPAEPHLMGHSALVYKNGVNGHEQAPVFSERADLVSIRHGKYKYIYNVELKTGELYDLQNDPGERKNLSVEDPRTAELMQKEILRWSEAVRKATPEQAGVKVDEKSVKELRSLGYIR